MDWQATLQTLRQQLPRTREAWGVRGSLRWLEEAMRARGASPSSVRNIVYRDIGTPQDKRALHGVLSELAAGVGQRVPPLPVSVRQPLPAELELLGRSKRRAYRQFLGAVRAAAGGGHAARLVVSGPAGAGKTLLSTHLERAIAQLDPAPGVHRLTLGGDLLPLFPDLQVQRSQPFAVQAEGQARAARALLEGLPDGSVLLLRVLPDGQFGVSPPRAADGATVSLTAWAAEQLYRLAPERLNVLLAAEDESALPPDLPGDHIRLTAPTPAEARRYLMAQLGVPAARADELVRQTGRNLDRLTLLAAARNAGSGGEAGQDTLERVLSDPAAVRLLAALSAVQDTVSAGQGGARLPGPLLEAALGQRLDLLPAHVRALLDESDAAHPRPLSGALLDAARPLLPDAERRAALTRLAATLPGTVRTDAGTADAVSVPLNALARLDRWADVARWLDAHPGGLGHAPLLWVQARGQARGEERESLARAVVSHHAMLGAYGHPQARDALFALLDSPREAVRAWARVKLAESSVDSGNFEAAEAQLSHAEVQRPLSAAGPDRWLQGAQADALLVGAALARWRGDLDRATRLAADPRAREGGALGNPARAALWRGLIAKDAGRWAEAMRELGNVPASHPLLSARARYQEGDLRLRLGQPAAALERLLDAAERLTQEQGAPEEQARVQARVATALRRLGRAQEALVWSRRATAQAGDADPVLRARLESESVPVLLSLFRPDEALRVAASALQLLGEPGQRHAEAAYRERRTQYRVALAYLTRGAGRPYQQPFGGVQEDHADLVQARRVLDALLSAVSGGLDREQVLTFDILLSRALADPDPARAEAFARRALRMTDHPYAEAQARATLADAHLRGGGVGAALHEVNRGHALLRRVASGLGEAQEPDPGLHALLLTLEARCLLLEGGSGSLGGTLAWLRDAAGEAPLRAFQGQVWREVGMLLERLDGGEAAAAALFPGLNVQALRLRDALGVAGGQPV
ncbi:tetratricopeptide repeat protein [Deinococcus aquiradiocola]|uniref:Uncharacterized protein n=1 Tax=Deinococcus aquiradiocola TaxID=393059 RepID=A0A917UQB4_9DEIO|nr:tetratricopeptide repeat protein [Deinococcus aquiradiocola]GGJ75124.1 hypothetical protein GCM10008939_19290 [Deinococcus aquiradiocola]